MGASQLQENGLKVISLNELQDVKLLKAVRMEVVHHRFQKAFNRHLDV